MYITYLKITAR